MAEPGKSAGPRNRIIDVKPPGAENDPDYVKFQRELEETQQGQGWLFGRGAFDRQDIMYLKELKEEVRTTEDELNEMASSEFARLRSKSDAEYEASLNTTGSLLIAKKPKKEIKPVAKLLPLKVAGKSAEGHRNESGLRSLESLPVKRARIIGTTDFGVGQGLVQQGMKNGVGDGIHTSGQDDGLASLLGYSDSEDGADGEQGSGRVDCHHDPLNFADPSKTSTSHQTAVPPLPHPDSLLSDLAPCPQSEDLKIKPVGNSDGSTLQTFDALDTIEVKRSTHQDSDRGKWV
ncbi:hypothetical protein CEUSTIGMA_g6526.t1 [Chlamydomonas eustigma]|uniref:Uncharacterized protein n=1 Tax=Chlamydomonas eustigma TaxID=1157962 RepID=A0A250X7Q8_9CHLO|nr:hypothetical protein CEUSTIGMA_g6526.t1 [Chlamydomonas eustigma]|eukprot:GAX79086.1 hypothetical protein CEUSTIGMA_g6526.t1 [Chlamydomonas eustigma]